LKKKETTEKNIAGGGGGGGGGLVTGLLKSKSIIIIIITHTANQEQIIVDVSMLKLHVVVTRNYRHSRSIQIIHYKNIENQETET